MSFLTIWFEDPLTDLWYFMAKTALLLQANGHPEAGKKRSDFFTHTGQSQIQCDDLLPKAPKTIYIVYNVCVQ
jgi:hypothetical protein